MVIHEESESPVEIAVIRKPEILEPKKYLMISNHIKELPSNSDSLSNSSCHSNELSENESRKRIKTSSKKSKKRKLDLEEGTTVTQISERDLTELRTVYQNCLEVINKIESKYGHLLNIHRPEEYAERNIKEVCNCMKNKKIVFDDDGQQHSKEIEDHICPILPRKHGTPTEKCSVETDSEEYSLTLPDDLPSLAKLLQDPNLKHRNKVIAKIQNIKQVYLNELKFNRPALIQAVKRDPGEVLGFIGVNLSSLPGYL